MNQPRIETIRALGEYITKDNQAQIIAEIVSFLEVQVMLKERGFTPMRTYFPGQNKPPKPWACPAHLDGDGGVVQINPDIF